MKFGVARRYPSLIITLDDDYVVPLESAIAATTDSEVSAFAQRSMLAQANLYGRLKVALERIVEEGEPGDFAAIEAATALEEAKKEYNLIMQNDERIRTRCE